MKSFRSISRIIALAVALTLMLSFASCTLLTGKLELKSFTVDRSTIKTSYYIGEEIDFTGIKATAIYTDESLTKVYTFDELTITYADDITATEGTKNVTVSFNDPNLNVTQSATVKITVSVDPNKPQHNSYYINTDDVKKEYVLGEELDLSGIKLFEKFSIGNDIEITDTTGLVFEGVADLTATVGLKTVIVKYNGESAGVITITVNNPAITSAQLSTDGVTLDYNVGDTLTSDSFAGLSVLVTYENGTQNTVNEFEFTNLAVLTATYGEKTVIAKYTDPISGVAQNASFKIRVDGIERYSMDTSAVKTAYFEGEALDFSAIVVTAKYFYAGDVTLGFDELTFVHDEDLTATSAQSKEVTVKVGDTEIGKFTVAVGDIIATPVVNTANVDLSYRVGEAVSLDGLTVAVTYNNGAPASNLTLSDLTVVTELSSLTLTAGEKQISLRYNDTTVNDMITLYVTVNVYGIVGYEIDASEMKTTYIVGDTVSSDGIKVYALYNDGGERALVEDLGTLTLEDGITDSISASKIANVYLGGNEIGTVAFVIEKNSITKQEITGTFDVSYETNEQVNFEGLTVTVTYKNGRVEIITLDKLEISGADTSTAGTKTVTASYTDPINNEPASQSFTITVIKAKAEVMGFEKPQAILKFETANKNAGTLSYGDNGFSGQFAEGGQVYIIGDDNQFRLVPDFEIRENGVSSYPTSFYMDVAIYIKDGDNYIALSAVKDTQRPTSVSFYNGDVLIAAVDTYLGSYQFTEAAVGNVVKISVLPSAEHYNLNNANTLTLEAEIIDAYNVYEAWQISVIDNYQNDLWREIKTAHGIEGYSPAGIVLHTDISITADDVPADFFYTTTEEITYKYASGSEQTVTVPAGTKYLKDGVNVYERNGNQDFTIQGNFFNLDSDKFPLVPSPAVFGDAYSDRHYGSDFSNSSLFMFDTLSAIFQAKPDKVSNVLIENLAIIGNAATNRMIDSQGNLVSAGGLIFLKSSRHTVTTMNNIVGNSFFITYFPEYAGTINANKVKCYDSYQNAIFVFADATMNIKDSYFVIAGGPIAICQSDEENGVWYNPTLNAENTVTYTSLSGEEIWFTAVNANTLIGQIKAIGTILQNNGLGNFVGTNDKPNINGKMHILGLLMKEGSNAEDVIGGIDACGSVWFNGEGIDRHHTTDSSQPTHWDYIYQASDAIKNLTTQLPPFFTVYDSDTETYTTIYTDGANLYDLNDLLMYSAGMAGAPAPISKETHAGIWETFQDADTIILTQGGISVMFEFYH